MITNFLAGHVFLTCCLGADPALPQSPSETQNSTASTNAVLFKISHTVPHLLGDATTSSANESEFRVYRNTQAELIKSNFVLSAALRRPQFAALPMVVDHKADAIHWLQEHLVIDFPGDAEILRLTFTDGPPAERARLLNVLADAYLDEIVHAEQEDRLRVRDLLERQYKKTREDIRARMEAIHSLRKSLGLTEGDEIQQIKKRLAEKNLERLLERRDKLEDRIQDLDIRIEVAEKQTTPPAESNLKIEREVCERHLVRTGERLKKQLEEIQSFSAFSSDIESRTQELHEQQAIASKLGSELKLVSINLEARPRVRQIESASAD